MTRAVPVPAPLIGGSMPPLMGRDTWLYLDSFTDGEKDTVPDHIRNTWV